MEISEEEAWVILGAQGDEDGETSEKNLKLEKRIRKEFPDIDENLKKSERREHLWEHEVEDDRRVKEARKKLEKYSASEGAPRIHMESRESAIDWQEKYDTLLNEFMNLKQKVLHELLEKVK